MKKTESLQNDEPFLSEAKLVAFIEALYRIFKVGIYYPTGHAVLDQSANKCMQQLRDISPTLEWVTISVGRSSLQVENIILPDTSTSVKELYRLLEKLGIRSFAMHISITLKPLLFFIRKLLAWRMQLESTQSFITFDVADLPQGIRLEQQEFLIDERAIIQENLHNDSEQNLDAICLALGEQGLNKQQVEQCRAFLQKLSEPQEGKKQTDTKEYPNATWEDVNSLLYKIVTGAYSMDKEQYDAVVNSDINVIGSIFQNLELTLTDKKSKETIKFLLSHLTGRVSDELDAEIESKTPKKIMRRLLEDDEKLTVSELKSFIYENQIPVKILEKITSVDSSEELSILLQLFSPDIKEELYSKLELKLKTILLEGLNKRGKEVLVGGILSFVDTGNTAYFCRLLTMVLQSLRDCEGFSSVEFIVDLWDRVPVSLQIVIWPYLVNELLVVGRGKSNEIFHRATEIASQLHLERMGKLCFQLEEMEACQGKKVAATIFDPTYIFSYKLFAVLFETSLVDTVARIIYAGLLEKPQDKLFAAIGPVLDLTRPAHFSFFRSYLAQAHLKEAPLALKMAAGQIILEFLQNISEEEKALPWVQNTITASAGLYVKGMKDMLHKIVKEKKMGVLPTWPRNCRIAAETTLKSMQRPSLSELL